MTRATCCSIILAAFAGATTLCAEDVKWDDLCDHAASRAVTIKTTTGITVTGNCDVNTDFSISLHTKRGVRSVARDEIDSIRIDNLRRSHCLAKVVPAAAWSLLGGFIVLGTPEFFWSSPFFIAASPAILVGGTPFCAVYDGINRLTGRHKITII